MINLSYVALSQGCTVFVAEQLQAGQHSREHEEQDMHQCWFTKASLENMIRDGETVPLPTIPRSLRICFTCCLTASDS